MSWRDNSSSSTNGTQDGNGGSMNGSGGVSGTGGGGFGGQGGQNTGGGGGYTFSDIPGHPNTIGNWNTGGAPVGVGSLGGGIMRSNPGLPMATPRPTGFNIPRPAVPPWPIRPIANPISMPPMPRMNPFARFSGTPWSNPGWGTDPTQPTSPISYGPPGGGKYQDRLSQPGGMGGQRGGWGSSGSGSVGGGMGGGGGGGWR